MINIVFKINVQFYFYISEVLFMKKYLSIAFNGTSKKFTIISTSIKLHTKSK